MTEPQTTSLFSTTWNDASEADVSYRQLSVTALLAFFFGLASFLVFFTIWFAFVSAIGIVLSLLALWRIRRSEGALSGLALARLGLCLSLVSIIAVAVMWPTYHYGIRREADKFFRIWFAALQTDNIPLAKGLSSVYWQRPSAPDPDDEPGREKWWTDQYENRYAHRSIHTYVDNKLVRTMLALGTRARVTYYKTLSVVTDDDKDTVVVLYAVTYPTSDESTETFFVKMTGRRSFPSGDVKSAGWVLADDPEFVVPEEFR